MLYKFLLSLTYISFIYSQSNIIVHSGLSTFEFSWYYQPEVIYAKNVCWLNDNAKDSALYVRHFFDSRVFYSYADSLQAKAVLRNRTVWGNNASTLLTTQADIQNLEVCSGQHRHGLLFADFWIRELWLESNLNQLLCLPFCHKHTLTLGAFFFELGRGISLGAGYPTFPYYSGIDVEIAIDQYPFGGKLSGELIPKYLTYDFYFAIFKNKDFGDTELFKCSHQHYGQPYNLCKKQVVTYATRLKGELFEQPNDKSLSFEPYLLVFRNPQVKFELGNDGESTLATLGLAVEYSYNRFEFGFECAFNRGGMKVFGIDRNKKIFCDEGGVQTIAYSQVIDTTLHQDAPVNVANSRVIDNSIKSQFLNNTSIAHTLKNKQHRFEDPYEIHYRGSFFIADMSYQVIKDCLKVSATYGYASGDADAHKLVNVSNSTNRKRCIDYWGFIAINETYVGKRVTSVLFLNGFGSFARPSTQGTTIDPSATLLNGFTDLVLAGFCFDWNYKLKNRKWHINPNVLFFWQDETFECNNKNIPKYFGVEVNCISEIQMFDTLVFYVVGAIFIPGSFYKAIEGIPLTEEQVELAKTVKIKHAFIGSDASFLLNFGLKYNF